MNWLCNDLPRRTNVRQFAGVNGVASQLPTLGKGCAAEGWRGPDACRWALGAARPVACGSRVAASRYALGAEGVGATRPGEYICSHPDACARCLLVVGMSKTSCASRCSRRSVQGALRAPAEGEGGLARREDLTAAAAATLERSAGTVAHGTRAARERRRRRAKVSRRRRAGGARPARPGRSSRVPRDSNERAGALGRGPPSRGDAPPAFFSG